MVRIAGRYHRMNMNENSVAIADWITDCYDRRGCAYVYRLRLWHKLYLSPPGWVLPWRVICVQPAPRKMS